MVMTTNQHTTPKQRLEPHVVRERLAKDVTRILSGALHQFEELEHEVEEKFFDVDGIISGRPSREQRASARRSIPQSRMRTYATTAPTPVPQDAHILTRPTRGNFIPSSHYAKFASR